MRKLPPWLMEQWPAVAGLAVMAALLVGLVAAGFTPDAAGLALVLLSPLVLAALFVSLWLVLAPLAAIVAAYRAVADLRGRGSPPDGFQ